MSYIEFSEPLADTGQLACPHCWGTEASGHAKDCERPLSAASHSGAIAVLQKIQWSGIIDEWDAADRVSCCPVCGRCQSESAWQGTGWGGFHSADCALANEAGLEMKSDDEMAQRAEDRQKAREDLLRQQKLREDSARAEVTAARLALEKKAELALYWAEEPIPTEVRALLRDLAAGINSKSTTEEAPTHE